MQFNFKKIDYTTPSGHEGGVMFKQITPYVGTPYINMTLAQFKIVQQAIGANLGSTWYLGGGQGALGANAFEFVRNGHQSTALALGQLVTLRDPTNSIDDAGGGASTVTTGAGTAASPTTTTAIVTTNIQNSAFTIPVPVNGDEDNWLFITSAAASPSGVPQMRRIKKNSSSTTSFYTVALPDFLRPNSATDADVFDNTPLNTEPISIMRPYDVMQCDATSVPIGVALGAVTAGNYTIIQKLGIASVLCDGSGGAGLDIVVNKPAVAGAAGVCVGINAADLYAGGTLILPQIATVAANVFIPCFINFMAA